MPIRTFAIIFATATIFLTAGLRASAAAADGQRGSGPAPPAPIRLRAYGVPTAFGLSPAEDADRHVIEAFRRTFPHVEPVSTKGIQLPGGTYTENMVPFMQIAGGVAPDVMYVNFKQSQTYIDMKLLYPLDRYVERLDGVNLPDGSALPNNAYVAELRKGAGWAVIEDRVPPQLWQVIRRECPFEDDCPYRREWKLEPLAEHQHIWSFPIGPLVMGLSYDRALFAEHGAEGIEQRAPHDWEEMLRWAKILTDPPNNQYGFAVSPDLSWYFLSFLYSAGGRAVEQDAQGNWRCVLDTDEAVEAMYFYARLRLEKVRRNGREYRGVIAIVGDQTSAPVRFGMNLVYLDDRFLAAAGDQTKGVAPVPAGPGGARGSEFNSMMCGIFADLADDPDRRDAAWEYIQFFDGPDARRIRVEKMVEAGLGPYVRRRLLERYNDNGRYDAILRRVPPELEQTYEIAFANGVPEPYGRNCQYIYQEMNKPIGTVWNSPIVRDAIDRGDAASAKHEIRRILRRATEAINQRMLGHLPHEVQQRRSTIAWIVIAGVAALFALVFWRVFRVFTPPASEHDDPAMLAGAFASRQRQRRRERWALVLLAPALLSLLLWMYWPLVRGTTIAFQDYSVVGDTRWIGSANFASVLFSGEFWHSMYVSLIYTALFLLLGFWTPIALAVLLQEVPRGKTLFRVLYYVPAVLTGAVVIFLWRSFYAPGGLLVQALNGIVEMLNLIPGIDLAHITTSLLDEPYWALFLTLVPIVWAGIGPGCLIYLAALKTIPEEMYEAAEIDGAGVWRKIFSVALPSIRALVMINLVGAIIGAVRGAGTFVLAMTGGGPFTESGGATEVVGLRIFYTTFGYLQFGPAAAMAWVVGSALIGFTVLQLQRLSKLEFRAAGAAPAAGNAGGRA